MENIGTIANTGHVLMGFHEESSASPGRLRKADWSVILPKVAVGLAPIRGGKGGVLIGGFHSDRRFGIQPVDWPSGLLDSHLGVNCDRDPRDGLLDVWTEDSFNQRLIWYRVDDRDIETFEGKFKVD